MSRFLRQSPLLYLLLAAGVIIALVLGGGPLYDRLVAEGEGEAARSRVVIQVTPQRDEAGNLSFRTEPPAGYDAHRSQDVEVRLNPAAPAGPGPASPATPPE
jgi:hypothetical protein